MADFIHNISTTILFIFILFYVDSNQVSAQENEDDRFLIECVINSYTMNCFDGNLNQFTNFSEFPKSTTHLTLRWSEHGVYHADNYVFSDLFKSLKNVAKLELLVYDQININFDFLDNFRRLKSLRIECGHFSQILSSNKSLLFLQLIELKLYDYSQHHFPFDSFCSLPLMKNLSLVVGSANNSLNIPCGKNNSCCLNLEMLNIMGYDVFKEIFLASNIFRGLYNLKYLMLKNIIISLHKTPTLFIDLHNLTEMKFISSDLSDLPDSIFFPLENLRFLDLSDNQLTSDSLTSLKPLKSLESLDLTRNPIKTLRFQFRNLPQLKKLVLSRNQLIDISINSFQHCHNFARIDLSENSLNRLTTKDESGNVKNIFTSRDLPKLEYLDLKMNKIHSIDSSMIPKSVKILNLQDNPITSFCVNHSLQRLNVDGMHLDNLDNDCFPPLIESLSLRNTKINRLPAKTFSTLKNLKEFHLRGTQLLNVDRFAFSTSNGSRSPVKFFLSQCCIYHQNKDFCTNRDKIIDAIETVPVNSGNVTDLCQYVKTCSEHTCDLCSSWTTNALLDCGSLNLSHVPSKLPKNNTILYLDGNNLTEVDLNEILRNYSLVQVLYLNKSNVRVIQMENGHSSVEQFQLQELHLEDNYLKNLSGKEFKSLRKLKKLFLHDNNIHFIEKDTFKDLTSLEILTLHNNKLKQLKIWNFNFSPLLKNITIHRNHISCQCEYLKELRKFLTKDEIIFFVSEIKCSTTEDEEYFADRWDEFLLQHCAETDRVEIIGLSVSIVLLVLIFVSFVLVFKYRLEIQVILYSRFNLRLFSDASTDVEKQFHAFVAYSYDDREFVANELEPGLEHYRLCLHDRHFVVGLFIQENIINAVNSSHCTLIIFSTGFAKSEWCKYEFRTAYEKTLKGRLRRILVIVIEDVDPDDLDEELKMYLRTTTYLRWEDKLFWEKLYFALPSLDGNDVERNEQNQIPLRQRNR